MFISNNQDKKLALIARAYNTRDFKKPLHPNGWTKKRVYELIRYYNPNPIDFSDSLNAFTRNAKLILEKEVL